MINNLLSVLIYGIYLVVPGYLFLVAAGIRENRFLLSYGISISILVITLLPFTSAQTNVVLWLTTLHVAIIFLPIAAIIFRRKRHINTRFNRKIGDTNMAFWSVVGCLLLLFSFSLYHSTVGPYTEIPSDFWKHLARVRSEFESLNSEGLNGKNLTDYLLTGSSPIYVFHSVIAYYLVTTPIELVASATLVTSLIFLVTVYWFCLKLLSSFSLDNRTKAIGALLAALLTLVTFGTATFSYVRYYAYFPTIFGFPLMYASIALFIDYLEQPDNRGWQLTLVPIFLTVMALIHHQEALLTLIMLAGIAIIRGFRGQFRDAQISNMLVLRATRTAQWSIILVLIIFAYSFFGRPPGVFDPTPFVIDGGHFFPLLTGYFTDNPSFRFWDTLGFFGIIVYVWYLLKWKSLCRLDFLTAGMLVPLLTNFNPLYASLFLRYGSPSGLWRTAYLMPLSIVAAILIVLTYSKITTTRGRWWHTFGIAMIGLLVVSQAPLDLQNGYNRTSRVPSLMSVNDQSGAGLWGDLIVAVETIQKDRFVKRIITDETSKFVLDAATQGRISPWVDHLYFPIHNYHYDEDFLSSDFSHSLLIINRRNGYQTASAQHSRHWPADILNISRHYPNDIDQFISEHTEYFSLLWATDGITIYMMNRVEN